MVRSPSMPPRPAPCWPRTWPGGCARAGCAWELRGDGRLSVDAANLVPAPAGPVCLAVDPEPLDTADPRRSTKSADRRALDERRARHPQADDVIVLGPGGEVVETVVANLLVRLDGRWCTPPLASGCLPGIGRGVLVEAGRVVERGLQRRRPPPRRGPGRGEQPARRAPCGAHRRLSPEGEAGPSGQEREKG